MPVNPTEPLLTVEEVASWLRLPVASIYAQRYRGDPPGSLGFVCGRYVRFASSEVKQWIEEQKERDGRALTRPPLSDARPLSRKTGSS